MPPSPGDRATAAPLPAPSGTSLPDDLGRVTRLAAYGVIHRGDAVLLCRIGPGYPAAGLWTLPGGGIEFGEAPDDAVVREVEEETGLAGRITGEPRILSHSGVWPARRGGDRPIAYHHLRFVYPMEVSGGSERMEVDGSTDACGWFTREQLADLPVVGLVSLTLGLPVRAGEDEVPAAEVAAASEADTEPSADPA